MYLPSHFAWTDPASLIAFCRAHAFATLVAGGAAAAGTGEAQHIPLLIDEEQGRLVLRGHVAAGDPLWHAARILAVFQGPHAYISAAWYDAPDTVPTWNYLAVHASGPLQLIADPPEVRACFTRLAGADARQQEWEDRLGDATYQRLAAAVRWFRIDVDQLAGKAKLSQNHTVERRGKVIAQLLSSADPAARATGEAMARTLRGEPPWPA